MKKTTIIITILAIVVGFTVPGSTAMAQSATAQSWSSSITYYTPSDTAGTLWVNYYQPSGAVIEAGPFDLAPHKAGSLFIGATAVPDGFIGSAVLSANVPIVATYVQFAAGEAASQYGRMLYNAFSAVDAGTPFYIPTVLYQEFNTTSLVGIQNIESDEITVNLKFYVVGSTTPVVDINRDINAYSSYVFGPADVGLSPGFNGSLVITGTGRVVASAQETFDVGRAAYAFEGVAGGSNATYMPSAMCNYGPSWQTSYYAIQNAGTGDANVTIEYYDTAGNLVKTMPSTVISEGGKLSRNACQDEALVNALGSAVIKSTGAEIIAIGKILANNGLLTAFVGESEGYTNIAAPYIRWSANPSLEWRSYIAIMNVGDGNATNITARYYDANGTLQATHVIATSANPLERFIKRNTTPESANALDANGNFGINPFGGAVEITSDQPVVVVVRLARNVNLDGGATTQFGEDYNGINIAP
jgi:hypothetical protein